MGLPGGHLGTQLGGTWEIRKAIGDFWEAYGRPRDQFLRSLGSVMAHFGGSLASSVGNVGPYEIHEIPCVFVGFSRVGRHPGGIGRHPGSIWNHLGGIWRQLGGIWRFLGGIWRLLGGRGAGLGDTRILGSPGVEGNMLIPRPHSSIPDG